MHLQVGQNVVLSAWSNALYHYTITSMCLQVGQNVVLSAWSNAVAKAAEMGEKISAK